MPSPFPGMDPYLEAQGLWPDVHLTLTNYIRESIAERLPESYEARINERVHLVEAEATRPRSVLPDVAVLHDENAVLPPWIPGSASVATVEPVTCTLPTEVFEARDAWVEIRRLTDRRLVTVIEVLSPTNKVADGFSLYKDKRRELLRRDVHVVEIDLLLGGNRLPVYEPLPPGDFYAFIARYERRPRCEVYPWRLHQPLPTLPVPLNSPDPDIALDLAAVFALTYERGRYHRSIDYKAPLPADWPLSASDRAWAESLGRLGSETSTGSR